MSAEANNFADLLDRARAGCPEAARELYHRHARLVRMVVRHHLSRRVRSLVESLDVCQDVWKSVFGHLLHEGTFASPMEFLRFLTSVAERKTLAANRHYLDTDKRDLRRRLPLQGPGAPAGALVDQHAVWAEAWLPDLLDDLSVGLPRGSRAILSLRVQGYQQDEIAHLLGVSERTVRRVLAQVRGQGQQEGPDGE